MAARGDPGKVDADGPYPTYRSDLCRAAICAGMVAPVAPRTTMRLGVA